MKTTMRNKYQKFHSAKKGEIKINLNPNILDKETSMKTFYEYLDVSKKYDFDNVPTAVLNCSVRVSNQLQKYNIKTLGDLFLITINDFLSMEGIGITSLTDLLSSCKQFLKTNGYAEPYRKIVRMKEALEITKNYTNSIVNNEYFDLTSVDTEYVIFTQRIDKIYSDLGEEFFKLIYIDSNVNKYTVSILSQIDASSKLYTMINLIEQKTSSFLKRYPTAQNIPVISFVSIWKSIFNEDLPEIFSTKDMLVDISKILLNNYEIPIKEKNSLTKQIYSFLNLLNTDIITTLQQIRKDINNQDKNKICEKVVKLKDEGNTLEEISKILGISRERVRKIYTDAIDTFRIKLSSISIYFIQLIHIFSDRKKILLKSDISSFFNDKMIGAWVWACLQNDKLYNREYFYSKKYDAVVFRNEEGELPEYIEMYSLFDIGSDNEILNNKEFTAQEKLLINIIVDILERFVQQNSPVHKSKIFLKYPEHDKYTLPEAMKHCHNIISTENGYFIHISTLSLNEEDYQFIKQFLETSTTIFPLNINTVYTQCPPYMFEFMGRNDITEPYKLFAILKYMFDENFDFNWPFIAKKDNGRNISRDVIISILEPYEEIDVNQLFDIISEKGFDPISFRNILHLVYPEYIRVNKNTLMKSDHIGLTRVLLRRHCYHYI